MASKLASKKCVACTPATKALAAPRVARLLREVPGWRVTARGHLKRRVRFEEFLTLMEFVNDMAQLAEEQKHHPDFAVHYNLLDIEIWTHAVGGLTESDFIIAAKLNELLGDRT